MKGWAIRIEIEEEELFLLKIGSLLHDIGHFISAQNHDQHGYYILKNSPMIGIDGGRHELIAIMVLNHRKTSFKNQEQYYKSLHRKEELMINQLSALLLWQMPSKSVTQPASMMLK